MKDYGKVESAVKPEPFKMDEYSVYIATEITPFEREIDGETFTGFTYHLVQYSKDEYILAQQRTIEEQITDTQLAICEIFENMKV